MSIIYKQEAPERVKFGGTIYVFVYVYNVFSMTDTRPLWTLILYGMWLPFHNYSN